jgi:hypothetical protein
MHKDRAFGFAISSLLFGVIGCHENPLSPPPVVAAVQTVQPGQTPALGSTSNTEIIVTNERLAGYIVSADTTTPTYITFEADVNISYGVAFPTKYNIPAACTNEGNVDLSKCYLVTHDQSFTCRLNTSQTTDKELGYRLIKRTKKCITPPPPPVPQNRRGATTFSVVHCNKC